MFQRGHIALAAEGAEDQAPLGRQAGGGDGGAAEGVHFRVGVGLAGEFAGVGVVAVGGEGGVVDHGGLEVEAAVADV